MPNYRNPNGYGSVVKLSGNRRKPFVVRKTMGYDDRAYPIYAIIGYYPSRKEAMIALAEYNHDPYDIEMSKITFSKLFEKWSKQEFQKMSKSLVSAHKAAYKYCSSLYDLMYKDIKKFQMQECIDNCGKSYATEANIKNLFVALDKFAYDNDIIDKCYSANLTSREKEVQTQRVIFTTEEIQTLWEHVGEFGVDETLFMLYTGCRLSEMLTMRCENVDLEQGFMSGGVKSAAGKNRMIPIHEKLLPIVKNHLSGETYLFAIDTSDSRCDDIDTARKNAFKKSWASVKSLLNAEHTTHECRHTFRSKMDSSGANKVCIDLIMGHKSKDVGERVYTHKTLQELKEAISKLSYDT